VRNYDQALKFADATDRKRTLRYELAQVYYEQGRMQEAFDHLVKLSDQSLPPNLKTSVNMALARTALEVGDPNLSWSVFRNNESALKQQFPREFLYFSGRAALEIDQLARASDRFDSLLAQYPNSPFGRAAVRMSFRVNLQRTDLSDTQQQRRLRRTIEQSPPDMRLSLLADWGNALVEERRFERARSIYDELLFKASDPAMKGEAIDRIVELELTRNQVDRAYRFLDNRWSELPVHPEAAEGVYRVLRHDYEQRNLDRLKKWARRFLDRFEQSPYHGHVYFMMGEIARRADRLDEARDYYARSLQNDPSEPVSIRANYRLGQLLYDKGDYERAVEFLEEVTGRSPDFVSVDELRTMIANAYFEIGRINRAQAMLEAKAQLTDPDRLVLAKIHFRKGEISETENYLGDMSPPERSELRAQKRFWQGRVAYRKDDLEKAENIWYETLYLYSDWDGLDQLMVHLANLLKEQGRTDEAEKLQARLREEFPDSPYREDLE
jgi:tetratricopeptide (TPR) repeat protein